MQKCVNGKMVALTPEEMASRQEEVEAFAAAQNAGYLAALRKQRDRLLLETDWTQLPDAPVTEADRNRWSEYRQQLRDMDFTQAAVQWPKPPFGDK